MRAVRAVVVLVLFAAFPPQATAACGDDATDAQTLAAAGAQGEAVCPCATALTHPAYVRCARGVTATRLREGLLRTECLDVVRRCALRSTCGRPDLVTCCLPAAGHRVCRRVRGADRCLARG